MLYLRDSSCLITVLAVVRGVQEAVAAGGRAEEEEDLAVPEEAAAEDQAEVVEDSAEVNGVGLGAVDSVEQVVAGAADQVVREDLVAVASVVDLADPALLEDLVVLVQVVQVASIAEKQGVASPQVAVNSTASWACLPMKGCRMAALLPGLLPRIAISRSIPASRCRGGSRRIQS